MPDSLHARQAHRELELVIVHRNIFLVKQAWHTWPVLASGLPSALAWAAVMCAAMPATRCFHATGDSPLSLMRIPCKKERR